MGNTSDTLGHGEGEENKSLDFPRDQGKGKPWAGVCARLPGSPRDAALLSQDLFRREQSCTLLSQEKILLQLH